MHTLMYTLLIITTCIIQQVEAYKWPIESVIHGNTPFILSEGHMYASNDGPIGSKTYFKNQDSIILSDTILTTYSKINKSFNVVYAVYGVVSNRLPSLTGLCENIPIIEGNTYAINPIKHIYQSIYIGTVNSTDGLLSYLNVSIGYVGNDDTFPTDDDFQLIPPDSIKNDFQLISPDSTKNNKYNKNPLISLQSNQQYLTNNENIANNNGIFFVYKTVIQNTYTIEKQALYGVIYQTCLTDDSASEINGMYIYIIYVYIYNYLFIYFLMYIYKLFIL